MMHDRCGIYGDNDWERCPICGLVYCPRCRTWFSDKPQSAMPGEEASDGQG